MSSPKTLGHEPIKGDRDDSPQVFSGENTARQPKKVFVVNSYSTTGE